MLIRDNINFIKKQVWKFCFRHYQTRINNIDDLFQEAAIGMLLFFRNADPSKYKSRYQMLYVCSKYMMQRMYDYCVKSRGLAENIVTFSKNKNKIAILGYDDLCNADKKIVENQTYDMDTDDGVSNFIKTLPPYERKIVEMRMMGYSCHDIAKALNRSEQRIRKCYLPNIARRYRKYFHENPERIVS